MKVSDGEQVRFTGQNSLQHDAYAAPAPDGFDDWAKVRDKRLDSSQSARYVAPGVIGYEDLDAYGSWQVVPTYGAIWVPTSVPAGWAPYRYGHWAWIAPWGWTWVDDAPWGFAPFHYGRWVSYGGYWGWAPGPIIGVGWRPYYAPALVGWVGGAGWGFGCLGFGFGFGGGCGWFPLGWGEPFYPWYHGYRGGYVSQNYIRNVNVTNTHITNINNVTNNYYNNTFNNEHYANRNVAGAVTAAPKSALASGQNIAKVGMVVPRSELGKGQVVRSVDVSPTRQAMLGGKHAAHHWHSASRRRSIARRVHASDAARASGEPGRRDAQRSAGAGDVGRSQPEYCVGTRLQPTTFRGRRSAGLRTPPMPAIPIAAGYSSQPGASHAVPKPPYAGGAAPSGTTSAVHNAPGNHGRARARRLRIRRRLCLRLRPRLPHTQQPSKQNESKPKDQASRSAQVESGHGVVASAAAPGGIHLPCCPRLHRFVLRWRQLFLQRELPQLQRFALRLTARAAAPTALPPAYRATGTYSAAPAYSARASAPAAPHYSAPSAPHYSGGGGGGGGHYSGGGSSGGRTRRVVTAEATAANLKHSNVMPKRAAPGPPVSFVCDPALGPLFSDCVSNEPRPPPTHTGSAAYNRNVTSSAVKQVAEANFPTRWGNFRIYGFEGDFQTLPDGVSPEEADQLAREGKVERRKEEAVALVMGDIHSAPPLVRIHSQCLTGDVFASMRCDCRQQLELALSLIAEAGAGILLYEQQEGRGIGLMAKIQAYELQDKGLDTIEANEKLGYDADYRQYTLPAEMLKQLGVKRRAADLQQPREGRCTGERRHQGRRARVGRSRALRTCGKVSANQERPHGPPVHEPVRPRAAGSSFAQSLLAASVLSVPFPTPARFFTGRNFTAARAKLT